MNAIDETIKYLLEALSLAKEMSLPGEEWQILAALSELYTSQGDENTARDHLLRAREIVQRLAKNIGDTQLHELFIRSKQVQLVLIDVR